MITTQTDHKLVDVWYELEYAKIGSQEWHQTTGTYEVEKWAIDAATKHNASMAGSSDQLRYRVIKVTHQREVL